MAFAGGVLEGVFAPDIDAHAGVELQRFAAGRGFRVAEHDADLFADLVGEDAGGLGLGEDGGELAQGPGSSAAPACPWWPCPSPLPTRPGTSAATESTTITSSALDRASVSQIVRASSPLSGCETSRSSRFTPSRLAHSRVQRVLGIDERRQAAGFLRAGDHVQHQRGFAGRFRAVDLDDASARHSAHAEGQVQTPARRWGSPRCAWARASPSRMMLPSP
jgi:hypothetical protein